MKAAGRAPARQLGALWIVAAMFAATSCLAAGGGPNVFYPATYWPQTQNPDEAGIVQLGAEETRDDLVIQLEDGGGAIEGEVRTSGDVLLSGVLVVARHGGHTSHALSGADGRFRITGAAPGENTVRAWTFDGASSHRELLPLYHPSAVEPGDAVPVNVTKGGTISGVDIVLDIGATVSGTIRGGDTGAGLEGVTVGLRRNESGDSFFTQTDADGSYSIRGLPPGTYLFHALPGELHYLEEYYDGAREPDDATPVVIESTDAVETIDAELEREGRIFGKVIGKASQAGLADLEVRAIERTTRIEYTTVTDAAGFFLVRGLRPGVYIVWVPAIGKYFINATRESDARPIVIAPGDEVFDTNITGTVADECGGLPKTLGYMKGQINISDNPPTEGWTMRAVSKGHTREQFFDSNGGYRMDCLVEGDYIVSIRTDSTYARQYYPQVPLESMAELVTIVRGDSTVEIDFFPDLASAIAGQVLGAGALPVTGAPVRVSFDDAGVVVQTRTDSDGRFAIHALPDGTGLREGSYTVSVDSFSTGQIMPTPVVLLRGRADVESVDGRPVVRVQAELPFGTGPFVLELHRRAGGVEQLIEQRPSEGAGGGSVEMSDTAPPSGFVEYRILAHSEADSLATPWLPVEVAAPKPGVVSLSSGPNPSRSEWRLALELDGARTLSLQIFTVDGRRIWSTVRRVGAGAHVFSWDGLDEAGRGAAAGIYSYVLSDVDASRKISTGRLVFIR